MVTTAGQQMALQANANVNQNVFGSILYNVKAYGAKGDGIANDTAAIQAAINAVGAMGGEVFFPTGSYLTTSSITMKKRVVLSGPIPGNVFFDKTEQAGAVIQYAGSDYAIKFPETPSAIQAGLKNISIIGNDTAKGGIQINVTATPSTPSTDLIFNGVCVSYFRNGYGLNMSYSIRNAFYSCLFRQCGVGINATSQSNDNNFYDTTLEWCNLGASFSSSKQVNMFGAVAEGLGHRAGTTIPSDLPLASGKTIADYHGGIRSIGSLVIAMGGYVEQVSGRHFILEIDSTTVITGWELECSPPDANETYVVDRAAGATGLTFTGNRVYNSPITAVINLNTASFDTVVNGNLWYGTKTGSFFSNVGEHIDGGMIQEPEKPARQIATYGYKSYAQTTSDNSYFRLFGTYNRNVLDNYWEWFRQNGDGVDKFSAIRRMNNGVLDNFLQFDPASMYFYKPIIIDPGQYSRLGRTAPTAPQTAVEGDMYWDTVAKTIKVFNGTVWKSTTLT